MLNRRRVDESFEHFKTIPHKNNSRISFMKSKETTKRNWVLK